MSNLRIVGKGKSARRENVRRVVFNGPAALVKTPQKAAAPWVLLAKHGSVIKIMTRFNVI